MELLQGKKLLFIVRKTLGFNATSGDAFEMLHCTMGKLFIDIVFVVQSKFHPTFTAITTSPSGKVYDSRGGYCVTADGTLTWKDSLKKVRILGASGSLGDSIANAIDVDAEDCSRDGHVFEHSGSKRSLPTPCRCSKGKNSATMVKFENVDSFVSKCPSFVCVSAISGVVSVGVAPDHGCVAGHDDFLTLSLGSKVEGSSDFPFIRSEFWRNCDAKKDYLTLSCGSKDEASPSDLKKRRL
ncbi:hypothetical protein MtrunA17_Chr1g0171541 [Medicago truncatula]|uniref:Uncharacterized protein n=1 Tax=Medicago truncatula TaxID=3880 RepID=A0A396JL31_MEDTR|nr:hypothetical protein MtrunA17_Chr1g0171541 [Medicago truncatula]